MSTRYVCPNDSEVLMVAVDASASSEFYRCAFCGYKSTISNAASALKSVDESYTASVEKKKKK